MTLEDLRAIMLGLAATALLGQTAPLATVDSLEERSGRERLKEQIEAAERRLRRLRAADKIQATPPARASAEDDGLLRPKIVNGVLTARHPTAVAVLRTSGALLRGHCSATLIGQRTILTAQHCVEEVADPGRYRVFIQHAGVFSVSSISKAPGYSFPVADVAVLKLAQTVRDIRPTPIWTGAVPNGTSGLVVGFGRSGGKRDDYGLKRAGSVRTAPCRTRFDNQKLVCWNYDDPIGLPGESSNTCNSDSGGPLYMSSGSRMVVAGITSGGEVESCLQGDHSYDVSVPAYSDWILGELGTDTAQPGNGSIVLERGSKVSGEASRLDGRHTSRNFQAQLRLSTRVARVALHGHDNGATRFAWAVNFTPTGATKPQRCAPETGQWAFCSFDARARGGVVSVTTTRITGEGQFQVTLTELD